jgi:hypothetical protein
MKLEDITENFTMIPNEVIKLENELTTKELLILTIILTTRAGNKNICIFNLQSIYSTLGIKSNNTKTKKEVKDILQLFKDENILQYFTDIFCTEEIDNILNYDKNNLIYAHIIDLDSEGFTYILDQEIKYILDHSKENKLDTSIMLKICLYILSFINENEQDEYYKLAFPKMTTIAENVDVTEKTVLKHVNALKELKILNFDYAGFKEMRDGKIKNGNMFYCRYEDSKILLEQLERERSTKGFIKQNKLQKDKSNLKRRITQEINYINKKIENNTADEIEREKIKLLKEEYSKLENR